MQIKLDELFINRSITINDVIDEVLIENDKIKDLEGNVSGSIYVDDLDNEIFDIECNGTMYIEDSINLEIIPLTFSFKVNDNLEKIKEEYYDCYEKTKNILDLQLILWQNIVLEVPISYSLVKDAELKGEGWELSNGQNSRNEIDPRLKKLEDLLKGDD